VLLTAIVQEPSLYRMYSLRKILHARTLHVQATSLLLHPRRLGIHRHAVQLLSIGRSSCDGSGVFPPHPGLENSCKLSEESHAMPQKIPDREMGVRSLPPNVSKARKSQNGLLEGMCWFLRSHTPSISNPPSKFSHANRDCSLRLAQSTLD